MDSLDTLDILVQFLYRLAGGLAIGMAVISSRQVSSGFFRNHLYVVMGLSVLAALVSGNRPQSFSHWPATAMAIVSYIGAVCWLYEAAKLGRVALIVLIGIAGYSLISITTSRLPSSSEYAPLWLQLDVCLKYIDPITSSWALGGVFTAMLLGHWYLNSPGMALGPLQKLIILAASGVGLRFVLWCVSLALEYQLVHDWPADWAFWLLHGVIGLLVTLPVLWMAWATLKIPNTQSATGILYVAVILIFLGEAAGLLVSKMNHHFPL